MSTNNISISRYENNIKIKDIYIFFVYEGNIFSWIFDKSKYNNVFEEERGELSLVSQS